MLRKWSLLGLADDTGVLNVGGRLGAALGPTGFRRCWNRFSGAGIFGSAMEDFGNWSPSKEANTENLLETLEHAAGVVESAHQSTGLSVVVGGGHDLGYAHLLGVSRALRVRSQTNQKTISRFKPQLNNFSALKKGTELKGFKLGCINLDAHFDLRKPNPKVTSGSPFYLAIENGLVEAKNLVEFGIQPQCNHPELYRYAKEMKIPYVEFHHLRTGKTLARFRKEVMLLLKRVDALVVSLDLDCVAEAYAPGVSAPQAEGFTSSELMEMMEFVGSLKKCVSLGIFELNPVHDRDDRTSRLAATSAFRFISKKLNLV